MRKVIFFFAATLASMTVMAQTTNIPYNLHFTAVARNSTTHNPVTTQVNVQLQVYHSSSGTAFTPDTLEYCEQINGIVPNAFGEFSVTFGTSTALLCAPELALTNTQWNHGNMWYVLQYDTLGGSLTPIDTGRFTSSTYAFASHTAEQLVNVGTAPTTGQTLTWNGSAWVAATPAGVLPGTIQAWAGATAPAGYLFCDGSVVNSSTYSALYSAIGTIWGNGTGAAGSFNLPDLRGRFMRGYDSTASNDPDHSSRTAISTGGASGNNVASLEADAFANHQHGTPVNFASNDNTHPTWPGTGDAGNPGTGRVIFGASNGSTDAQNTTFTGGNETRPKNVSVMYIIKY